MTNTVLLRKVIQDSGLKISAIKDALGIRSYTTLRDKIDNKRSFTASEIMAICKLLNLSMEERERIFFAEETELNSVSA